MSQRIGQKKVLAFGFVGIIGCLVGWGIGEVYWCGVQGNRAEAEQAGPTLCEAPQPPPQLPAPTKPSSPPPALTPEPPPSSPTTAPPPFPPEVARRLEREHAEAGAIEIALSWNNHNDLDLHCVEPDGTEVQFSRKESASGGKLDVDMNAGGWSGPTSTDQPVEHIRWKETPPPGHYKVYVEHFIQHEGDRPVAFQVLVKGNGRTEVRSGSITQQQKLLVYEFDVEPSMGVRVAVPPEVTVTQGGKNDLTVRIARDRCSGPVELQFTGQIEGLHFGSHRGADAQRAVVPAGQKEVAVSVQADEFAPGGTRRIQVVAKIDKARAEAPLLVQLLEAPTALRIAAPAEVPLNAGGSNTLLLRVARDHCAEPVAIRFEGDLEGLTFGEAVVPPDKSEIEVTAEATEDVRLTPRQVKAVATGGTASAQCEFRVALSPATVEAAPAEWSWRDVLTTGGWTAILAVSLAWALVMAQNRYQGKRLMSLRQGLLLATGGVAAGLLAGGTGQILFDLLVHARLPAQLGFLAGWLLLGLMLGWGIGWFIPNLKVGRAALAGAFGGGLGAAAFIVVAIPFEDFVARGAGAALLGFCLGLSVAIVEAVCREAWIEVYYGPKECKTFSLGRRPVTIGSGSDCTVYVGQAPAVALSYVLADGRIRCSRGGATASSPVAPGHQETIGAVRVVVRGNVEAQAAQAAPAGGTLWLRLASGQRHRLAIGERLGVKELPGLAPYKGEGVVTEVVANPKNPSILGLKNLSKSVWSATLPDGTRRQIELGQSVQLRVGLKIDFGALRGEVVG
jgi:hypothetical protein